MTLTCPCCHAKYPLDAALEGEAAGELQLLLASCGPLARPLVAYLGMFRSKSRALSFDRAVKLAREVLELPADPRALATALIETVEALRRKRDQGDIRPLKDHRYLASVLQTVAVTERTDRADLSDRSDLTATPAPRGKRAQAIAQLAEWGGGDWLRAVIADGLSALLTLGLDGTPGADVITRTADVWHHVLAGSCTIEALDASRLKTAFSGLLKGADKWPEPKAVWKEMPARPRQEQLPEPPPSPEARQRGKQFFEQLAGSMGLPAAEPRDEEERRCQLQEQARQLREGDAR